MAKPFKHADRINWHGYVGCKGRRRLVNLGVPLTEPVGYAQKVLDLLRADWDAKHRDLRGGTLPTSRVSI